MDATQQTQKQNGKVYKIGIKYGLALAEPYWEGNPGWDGLVNQVRHLGATEEEERRGWAPDLMLHLWTASEHRERFEQRAVKKITILLKEDPDLKALLAKDVEINFDSTGSIDYLDDDEFEILCSDDDTKWEVLDRLHFLSSCVACPDDEEARLIWKGVLDEEPVHDFLTAIRNGEYDDAIKAKLCPE